MEASNLNDVVAGLPTNLAPPTARDLTIAAEYLHSKAERLGGVEDAEAMERVAMFLESVAPALDLLAGMMARGQDPTSILGMFGSSRAT